MPISDVPMFLSDVKQIAIPGTWRQVDGDTSNLYYLLKNCEYGAMFIADGPDGGHVILEIIQLPWDDEDTVAITGLYRVYTQDWKWRLQYQLSELGVDHQNISDDDLMAEHFRMFGEELPTHPWPESTMSVKALMDMCGIPQAALWNEEHYQ